MNVTAEHAAGNYQSVVDNGREHDVVLDLPETLDGDDEGPTALELSGMALAGCISTIWAKVAHNSNVSYRKIEVEVDLEQADGAPTLTDSEAVVRVDSSADQDRLERVLDKTMQACPVGRLFEQAGVETETMLVKETPLHNGTP
jgi:Predicted redox protein, regulator of disulfide bond formation